MMNRWIIATLTVAALSAPLHAEDPVVHAWLAGDMDTARQLLEKEDKGGELSQSRRLLLARVCFRQQAYDRAQLVLTDLLREDVDHPQARELLGRTLFHLGDPGEAIDYYEDALRLRDDVELRFEYAECLQKNGRVRDAVRQLTRIVDAPSPPVEAYLALGRLRLQDGTGRWASRYLWAAHKSGSPEKELPWLLAQSFFMEGKALGPLKVESDPDACKPGDQNRDGTVVRVGDRDGRRVRYVAGPDSAIHQLLHYLHDRQPQADQREMLAACWLEAGQYGLAGEALEGADDSRLKTRTLRVQLAMAAGDLAATVDQLDGWPERDDRAEGLAQVRLLLDAALLAESRNDKELALKLLQNADEVLDGRADVLQRLIHLTYAMGDRQQAARYAHELHERYPESELKGELTSLSDVSEIRQRGESGVRFE